jgi:hypothetical protein
MRMKFLCILFLPISVFAQTEGKGKCLTCDAEKAPIVTDLADKAVSIAAANGACPTTSLEQAKKDLERAKKVGPNRYKIVKEVTAIDSRTALAAKYTFDNFKLNTNDAIYLTIPEDLQQKELEFVVLAHHQVPGEEKGYDGTWDKIPAYTSVQILAEEDGKLDWHYWNGDASGPLGSKFAERRDDYEWENLYEWHKEGHSDMSGKSSSKPLHPLAVRIASTGPDLVRVGQLEIKTIPSTKLTYDETDFSKGTSFPDYSNGKNMEFGGGQGYGGKFPGALALGSYNSSDIKLPENWKLDSSGLSIPLKEGKEIASVEIAVGDSHPDGVHNSDGGTGTQGWAKLNVNFISNSNTEAWLTRENVAPQGLTYVSPKNCTQMIQKGDRLLIRATGDTAYIMGIRIGYK